MKELFAWLLSNPRGKFNLFFAGVAAIVAAFSLAVGLCPWFSELKKLGPGLTAIWVLAPPIFFWCDWVLFPRELDKDAREIAKHTHDLARNIWVAFAAILAYLFGIHIT